MNRRERKAGLKAGMKRLLPVVQQRPCGPCAACCTTLRVDALRKPSGMACKHERPPGGIPGCGIYSRRPNECATFFCAWRVGIGLESERPDRVGYVMYAPGQYDGRPPWYAVRDIIEGSGAGWAARERIETVALERGLGIGICTPITEQVVRDVEAMGPGGPLPEMGTLATFFFGPPLPRAEAERRFAADR